ncbi:TraC family protein, partial [Patescibacteria group bacterium]|nr:TraC family protein [Patescibacteria group bacterium]
MPDSAKIAIRASTQEHLEIEDIKEGIVILKDGSSCLVLATTAINFGLLSEKEQEATIYAYAALLNSLNFTIQIIVRSARKDISSYLALLEERETKEERKLIKDQIGKYRQFIQETVQKNNVLDKKFYIIIPMSAIELGVAKTFKKTVSRQKNLPFDKSYILQQAKINLYPKRDHLLRQLSRLGLKSSTLESQELIRLFFNVYNPESSTQPMAETSQYKTPMVKAAIIP